jgi:hypothetical protein
MDNDILVVTDKEVYLIVLPAISKLETESGLRNWLQTRGSLKSELTDAVPDSQHRGCATSDVGHQRRQLG